MNIDVLEPTFERADRIAAEAGFIQRKPRKIRPLDLLKACCMLAPQGPSLGAVALVLSALCGEAVSKQAVAKRIGKCWVEFLKQSLTFLLCRQVRSAEAFSVFGRVLVEDSSSLALPPELASSYPGSGNQNGKNAQAKIQAIVDVKNRSYVRFSLSPFTRNDQAAASDVLDFLEPGDVIVRDLGYFSVKVLAHISERGAFFVSRFRYKCSLFDSTGPLNLVCLLKKERRLDLWARIGSSEKLPARIVAIPVSPQIAEKRRRKLTQSRDSRLNPSKDQLFLLGWSIFVTNIDEDVRSSEQIAETYGLRWRIEIVFKAWKSHFGITSFSRTASLCQIESLIYARLIAILLFHVNAYNPLRRKIGRDFERKLSLLKLSAFFITYRWLVPIITRSPNKRLLGILLARFCAYDKRKRPNYENILEQSGREPAEPLS